MTAAVAVEAPRLTTRAGSRSTGARGGPGHRDQRGHQGQVLLHRDRPSLVTVSDGVLQLTARHLAEECYPFNVVLTQAWGGLWDAPTDATPYRVTMTVDGVRVWR